MIWWSTACWFTIFKSPNTTDADEGHTSFETNTRHDKTKHNTRGSALKGIRASDGGEASTKVRSVAARSWHNGGVNTAYADGSD
ncbi:MAG: hypothetical protein LBH00_07155 [Planctomycetaceae bacterium]|nr:hypothetical protein [Planctomycetaceae bacterium]